MTTAAMAGAAGGASVHLGGLAGAFAATRGLGDAEPGIAGVNVQISKLSAGAAAGVAALKTLETAGSAAFNAMSESIGNAVASFAMYSRAQDEATEASTKSAATMVGDVATQVQVALAGMAKQAAMKALWETAQGLAALAGLATATTAPLHFAAAGTYAAIAGGGALAGRAIGEFRPANSAEVAAEQESGGGAGGQGSSSGGGSGDWGDSKKESSTTLVLNVGAGVFATREELGRDMRLLLDKERRLR